MVFITLGSQKFQFNRLLKAVDELLDENLIDDDVLAQIGYSDYTPKNFKYKSFLDRDEFAEVVNKSDVVITHGGTGAIIGAVKKGKKVIAVPRLAKYGEHVDDHQLQIVEQFSESDLISKCLDCSELANIIKDTKCHEFKKYISNTQTIIDNIREYLNS